MKKNIVPLLLLLGTAAGSYAQAPTPLYLKTVNSYLPPSPESSQLMKYQDYPVNLYTGTPDISIPFYTVSGKGISVPISLSYHAGGGVKIDDQATNIGLGFSIIAGGEITREQRSGPDEGGPGTTGYLNKPLKMWQYVQKYNDGAGTYDDQQLWVDAMNGNWDVEPDIFYFSFGSYSGKFVYDDMPEKFVCIDEKSHLNISFDRSNLPNSVFTIVADDGNKYIFSARETSRSQVNNIGLSPSSAPTGPETTTSWKLTKIVNADKTDSIMLDYEGQLCTYWTTGANIDYETMSGPQRYPVLSFSNNTIGGQSKLSKIRGTNFSVDFIDESADRLDLPAGNKALSKIVIKNSSNEIDDIFVLHHSYFTRSYPVGQMPVAPASTLITKSLRLDSISEYGNSESNLLPIRHAFYYNQTPLPARLSYAKDWWGYANSNTYTNSLIPPYVANDGVPHTGANRKPNFYWTAAGILTSIRLPTGGMVNYEYEPNTTAIPVEQASLPEEQLLDIDQAIIQPDDPITNIFHDETLEFTINVPPNATLNNTLGGVIADISFFPIAPTQQGGGWINGLPYYFLDKLSNIDYTAPAGSDAFHRQFQSEQAFGIYLPNGHYRMSFFKNNYNPPPNDASEGEPSGQFADFRVSYKIPDPNAPYPNYSLAGLRVKSITTIDPYSKATKVRKFRYQDPVTDSSYGMYIGNARNSYWEISQFGQGVVRHGSLNMPGQGNMSNSIIYPKVIEEVADNGVTYRTEHYYSCRKVPSYPQGFPFSPVLDFAGSRGNEEKTIMDKYTTSGFVPAAIKIQRFNDTATSLANGTQFGRPIQAMKCSATSYDEPIVIHNGFAPPIVGVYQIAIGNRLYLDADSMITYDLNNPNNKITEWHDYKYGDYNLQPIVIRSGNSDGTVNIQKNYYAADKPDATTEIYPPFAATLTDSNRVSFPLGSKLYKDAQLLNQSFTYAHFNSSKLLVDSIRVANFDNDLETEVRTLEYDDAGNPLTIEMRGNKYRKYLWNKTRGLPLATAIVPKLNSPIIFTSFEYPNENISWNENHRVQNGNFAGNYLYNLNGGDINFPSFSANGDIDIFLWANNSDVRVNDLQMDNTGRTKGVWTLFTKHFTSGSISQLHISGNAFLDNLVIIPSGSQFKGKVYDNNNRIVAEVNEQIATSFFEYDPYGRLSNIRDEKGNIIKTTSYQYQGDNN